ncbi:hypothetical protein CDAR_244971 [Caerostris darwini]|uniref:Uncharacterized protein n=1 Tax=Caerostris darwini TaxID=1538125 RepID=A0AAV4RAE6_9ARAC|nr:hypothetical protein CDAR_244971 [Caerostris darwini]
MMKSYSTVAQATANIQAIVAPYSVRKLTYMCTLLETVYGWIQRFHNALIPNEAANGVADSVFMRGQLSRRPSRFCYIPAFNDQPQRRVVKRH